MSREMKYSGIPWIGEIPKDWSINLLSSLFDEHKQKNKDLSETNLLSLSYGKIIKKDINTKEGLLPESFDGYNIISDGDIVFRLTDLQNDKRSLRTGLCFEKGIITSAYVTIRARQELHSPYYHYLVHSYDVCKVFYGMGDGVRQGMNYSDLRKLFLISPSFSEQQKIVEFLDKKCGEVDEMIALQEQIIEELKAYKQSVITEAVTKGLNPNVPMKDSGIEWIGEIPEHWEIHPFKAYYKTTKGLNITKENLVESGIPVISYGQIHSKLNSGTSICDELIRYVPESYLVNNPECLSKKFDMFFADTSEDREGAGNMAFIDTDTPIFAGYHTIIARPNEEIKTKYFAYLTKTNAWRTQIRNSISGVKVFSISQKLINRAYIIIPTPTEQQSIADYLDKKCDEIDKLIAIKQYKKSIIYEYVTGKKEVV